MAESRRPKEWFRVRSAGSWPVSRFFLRLFRCSNVAEVLRDLDEEAGRRRSGGERDWRTRVWWTRQMVGVVMYELADFNLRRRGARLRPQLAGALALKSLRRAPGVPIAAALTLGLGFGAAAAIYGVYSGFDRPIPVPNGAGVHWIRVLDDRGGPVPVSGEDLESLQRNTSHFSFLGGFSTFSVAVRYGERSAAQVRLAAMTPEVFDLLAVEPTLGRNVGADDQDAVVLSHSFWMRYLGGDDGILGRRLRFDHAERVIVGVMPEGHRFPFNQDLWIALDPGSEPVVELVARLHSGRTVQQAGAEVEHVLESRRIAAAGEPAGLRVDVLGFTQKRGEAGEGAALATLLALVVALVLVSCSNVSNLLLSRALTRADSLVVHAALGAGPSQVALQMLAEALTIALGGALVGLALSAAAIRYIESTLFGHWGYYWMEVRFEPGVIAFTLLLAMLTGLISGVMPAVRLWRTNLADVLRSDAAGVVGGGPRRLSTVLLNGQVAFSCFALIIAMLLAGALLRSRIAEGYPAEEVLVSGVVLEGAAYDQPDRRRTFRQALFDELLSDRRVGPVAMSSFIPGVNTGMSSLEVEGVERDPDARPVRVPTVVTTATYFDVFAVRAIAGRLFSDTEARGGEEVAVVSESFAREYLSDADPLTQRIRLQQMTGDRWVRVIGVVTDLEVFETADRRELARAYLRFQALEPRDLYLLYRGDSGSTESVRSAIARLDPDVAVTGVFGLEGDVRVADVLAYVRRIFQTTGVLALLGGISAAVVAVIGLYGAVAFEVQRRVAEIGVRMALGAASRDVLAHTARAGLRRVAPGLLVGFLMSASIGPLLGVLLGRMDPLDSFVYLGVFLGYLAVTTAATLIPGRRASRLDPVAVLRSE